jgi:hypothetical protein
MAYKKKLQITNEKKCIINLSPLITKMLHYSIILILKPKQLLSLIIYDEEEI